MDLADQVEDFICTFQAIGDLEMDSLIQFVFVWALTGLGLLGLGQFLYQKYLKRKQGEQGQGQEGQEGATPPSTAVTAPLTARGASTTSRAGRGQPPAPAPPPPPVDLAAAKQKSSNLAAQNQSALRKRLTRKSPGPDVRHVRNFIPPAPSNVVGSDETTVTWTSQVFKWLYSDLVIVNDLLYGWIQAINLGMRTTSEENGILVEIVRVLPESTPPAITNIFCEKTNQSVSQVVISFDLETTIVLQIKALRQMAGKQEILHYRATLPRFKGHLSLHMNYQTLIGRMKLEGYPDIKIQIASIGPIKGPAPGGGGAKEEQQIQDWICEDLSLKIRDAELPVDLSVHATCPRALKMEPALGPDEPQGSFGDGGPGPRRLLVKIVKGDGLQLAQDPFCVVEMDEPAQKNQTGARQGSNPFWDEHFLFDLSGQSTEILFEVYDRPPNPSDPAKFLGLGLVGIDELTVGPSSSQIIALQPRPYETDPVFGAITVEFVFIEGAQVPPSQGRRPYKLKEALKIEQAAAGLRAQQPQQHIFQPQQQRIQQNNRNLNPNLPSSTSQDLNNLRKSINNSQINQNSNENVNFSSFNAAAAASAATSTPTKFNLSTPPPPPPPQNGISGDLGERKRTTIFGTLRKRLTRSKTRDLGGGGTAAGQNGGFADSRSVSADRLNQPQQKPQPQGQLRLNSPPLPSAILSSRRSSISDTSAISGLSSASTKTFLHEASSLVLEVVENGVKRHYLVPMSIAQKPRWRRKGTKLHIYNDHTFVAKHLPGGGGLICEICHRTFPRRPGKQGYECRDCLLKCHKQCHIRTPQLCSKPTILSIELSSLPLLKEF